MKICIFIMLYELCQMLTHGFTIPLLCYINKPVDKEGI